MSLPTVPSKGENGPENTSAAPKPSSWADDDSSPISHEAQVNEPALSTSNEAQVNEPALSTSNEAQPPPHIASEAKVLPPADMGQVDGASEPQGGSGGIIEPNYDVDVKLSDVQADPNNPLYSIKKFEDLGLHEDILKGIYQMRFSKPSKIQEKALPLLLANPPTNLIGQSQSGTELNNPAMNDVPQALCLAPTRELARQIIGVIQLMGSFVKGLNVLPAIPLDVANRGRELKGQIVVGTPGTVMDLIRKRLLQANQIKVLVLDEADNMLDLQGMGDQCIRVKQLLPKNVQTVLFSATFPDKVVAYAQRFAPNANQITLRHEELTVEGIKQLYLDCNSESNKYEVLLKLYGLMTIGSSIIFVKTRATADRIEKKMNEEGHKVVQLTGAFEGSQRDSVIDSFREGKAKVLIATNVLSRGIDVQTVSLVVNYDLPYDANNRPDPETYLHRIGRTGRFGRVGVSISLVHDEHSWQSLREIGDFFGVPLTGLNTSNWDDVEAAVKKIIKSSRAGANFRSS